MAWRWISNSDLAAFKTTLSLYVIVWRQLRKVLFQEHFPGWWLKSYFWSSIYLMVSSRQHGLPWWLSGKESACQCRTCRFNPWVGKIFQRWKCNPFRYSCLANPMDRGSWQAIVHGVSNRTTTVDNIFSIITFNPCVN